MEEANAHPADSKLPMFNVSSGLEEWNALFVAPKNPVTFWSFDKAVKIGGEKCAFQPPLLTVAGQMPENYNLRVIDENVTPLEDEDIEWADVVIPSGMIIHFDSMEKIIQRANQLGVPVLAGGPLPTQYAHEMSGNATYFQGESEAGFHKTLEKIVRRGYVPEREIIDRRGDFKPLKEIPPQRFDLIDIKDYANIAIQITRGCPEKCTFCNIPALYGKDTRLKNSGGVIKELDILYDTMGWKGGVMITDDNMVGNQEAIRPILRDIGDWQKERGYPFSFFGQVSLRMYESLELMDDMRYAGFKEIFMGLESPYPASLKLMGAQKNLQASCERGKISMLNKVKDIQRNHFRVMAGFILGFDSDPPNIADMMKEFIDETRIGVTMVGPLGVLPDTPDWKRYSKQGRLVEGVRYSGDSGIFSRELSFVPHDREGNEIDPNVILDRHREVVKHVNSPKEYFKRSLAYLVERERKPLSGNKSSLSKLPKLFRSLWYQGVRSEYKGIYWHYLFDVLRNDPKNLADAVHYAAQGHHVIETTRDALRVDDYHPQTESWLEQYKTGASKIWAGNELGLHEKLEKISVWGNRVKREAEIGYNKLHTGLRKSAEKARTALDKNIDNIIDLYRGKTQTTN